MKRIIRMLVLTVMTAILVVLLITPVKLSSDIIFETGKWMIIDNLKTCNCAASGSTECGCLTIEYPED